MAENDLVYELTESTYDRVYEVVRQIPADLLTLAREGKKAHSVAFEVAR